MIRSSSSFRPLFATSLALLLRVVVLAPTSSAWLGALGALGFAEPSAAQPFNVTGTLADVRLERIDQGLDRPVFVTHARDERLFVVERGGTILIRANGQRLATPFLDLTGIVGSDGFEQGLLSIAFHPSYAQNGQLFVAYTNLAGDSVLARYRRSSNDPNRADPNSGEILLTVAQPFENHNGGQLQFGPDGYLYYGLGDGGSGGDPDCRAQKTNELLGKILRLDVDRSAAGLLYAIPSDNPFIGDGGHRDEVWAIGVRNPWRFSFDRGTGNFWIADVGQNVREEIDVLFAGAPGGKNLGWKPMEGSLCFGNNACPNGTPVCGDPSLVLPRFEYEHVDGHCSVTGGYVYRGPSFPVMQGLYFFGDFCSGRIWAADAAGPNSGRVRRLAQSASQLTTFGEDAAGELYAATLNGDLYRIEGSRIDATVAVFEPNPSRFLLRLDNAGGPADLRIRFGAPRRGAYPLAGDWNGDGKDGLGVYDPALGRFRIDDALDGGAATAEFTLGPTNSTWLPIAGDWDGDGKDGVGLYDPMTSTFRLKNRPQAGSFDLVFRFGRGNRGLLPVAGDWNGDGKDGIGVFDPALAIFSLRDNPNAGRTDLRAFLGTPGAPGVLPLSGDWRGDGQDGVGIFDSTTARLTLKDLGPGPATGEILFNFGPANAGARPIGGRWR